MYTRTVNMNVDTKRVIYEVRERPILWDVSHSLYKDRGSRIQAWNDVFEELYPGYNTMEDKRKNKFEKLVQQRWKTARDAYMRSKNNNKNTASGYGGSKKKMYLYFDDMTFLDKRHRTKTAESTEPMVSPNSTNEDSNTSIVDIPNTFNQEVILEPQVKNNNKNTAPCSGGSNKEMYVYFDEMTFLDKKPLIKVEESTDPMASPNSTNENSNTAIMDIPNTFNQEAILEPQFNTPQPQKKFPKLANKQKNLRKRKFSHNPNDDFYNEMMKMFKENAKLMKNDDVAFFMSLLPVTEKFSVYQKLLFRTEVLKKAMEIGNMSNPNETNRSDSVYDVRPSTSTQDSETIVSQGHQSVSRVIDKEN